MLQYRKDKQGKWVVFGPAEELKLGMVTVTKKSGEEKAEKVLGLSKPFDVEGVPHCFGYLDPPEKAGGGKATACRKCGKAMRPSKYEDGKFYCPDKACREKGRTRGRCSECDEWGDLGERCQHCYEGTHC